MRGTLRCGDLGVHVVGIIPAHAGNTDWSFSEKSNQRDHPRACGEHESRTQRPSPWRGSSPRMRGTPTILPCACFFSGIIPAHAGEHCPRCGARTVNSGSSPRMRGTRGDERICYVRHGIIPAHAGNTPLRIGQLLICGDHPRACGEHTFYVPTLSISGGSSPRMRGTQHGEKRQMAKLGIIPAHAGNTDRHSCRSTAKRDHPRACGEHDSADITGMFQTGSSPRMRGTPPGRGCNIVSKGIIPAHAGNTSTPCARPRPRRDHPRACGEHIL